jgi:hypothetical protein
VDENNFVEADLSSRLSFGLEIVQLHKIV